MKFHTQRAIMVLQNLTDCEVINRMLSNGKQYDDGQYSIEARIVQELLEFGVPAHTRGYDYLITAILHTCNDPSLCQYVTKDLYHRVARKYHTSASAVERTVSQAVNALFAAGNMEKLHVMMLLKNRPLSAPEFIQWITDKLRQENR